MPTACKSEWGEHIPRRAITRRKFTLPSWWLGLAPGQCAAFWVRVERARAEAGVSRNDRDGMAYIVNLMSPRRRNNGVPHEQQRQGHR